MSHSGEATSSNGCDPGSVLANVQVLVNELITLRLSNNALETKYQDMEAMYHTVKEKSDEFEGENARLRQELDDTRQTLQNTVVKKENMKQSALVVGTSNAIKEEFDEVMHQRTVERLEHGCLVDSMSGQLADMTEKYRQVKEELELAKAPNGLLNSTPPSFDVQQFINSCGVGKVEFVVVTEEREHYIFTRLDFDLRSRRTSHGGCGQLLRADSIWSFSHDKCLVFIPMCHHLPILPPGPFDGPLLGTRHELFNYSGYRRWDYNGVFECIGICDMDSDGMRSLHFLDIPQESIARLAKTSFVLAKIPHLTSFVRCCAMVKVGHHDNADRAARLAQEADRAEVPERPSDEPIRPRKKHKSKA
ncbi:uncharacterized protein B0H18DRAFT_1010232 [Fomitopsis serialis]|uniref:uncharacterized protein n=1 Tax=Fomitopsis serialis TaxID=139415 RepID=UPI0020081024|nr:uncharacterized protein B0H18DRAFT_1010232 [Neoantrodia serialis]KAH9925178.1 hypothetical protein B0H18DRAFT_1010232 [Neoantrodia serialis]